MSKRTSKFKHDLGSSGVIVQVLGNITHLGTTCNNGNEAFVILILIEIHNLSAIIKRTIG